MVKNFAEFGCVEFIGILFLNSPGMARQVRRHYDATHFVARHQVVGLSDWDRPSRGGLSSMMQRKINELGHSRFQVVMLLGMLAWLLFFARGMNAQEPPVAQNGAAPPAVRPVVAPAGDSIYFKSINLLAQSTNYQPTKPYFQ